jgi:hypothetical protein
MVGRRDFVFADSHHFGLESYLNPTGQTQLGGRSEGSFSRRAKPEQGTWATEILLISLTRGFDRFPRLGHGGFDVDLRPDKGRDLLEAEDGGRGPWLRRPGGGFW